MAPFSVQIVGEGLSNTITNRRFVDAWWTFMAAHVLLGGVLPDAHRARDHGTTRCGNGRAPGATLPFH
jgi:hypothetical protein